VISEFECIIFKLLKILSFFWSKYCGCIFKKISNYSHQWWSIDITSVEQNCPKINIFNSHRKKNIGWKMSFYLFIAISFYLNILCELGLMENGGDKESFQDLDNWHWTKAFREHLCSKVITWGQKWEHFLYVIAVNSL